MQLNLNESTKLEFGNKEQIRVLQKMQEDYYSYWKIVVKDNFGYETGIETPYAYKYEDEAIEYAKDCASRWSTLFETFEYTPFRVEPDRLLGCGLDADDFEDEAIFEDYCREEGIELNEEE